MNTAEQSLREMVRNSPGARLPSERDLAARLGISRPKLRALLLHLQSQGLVESRQGSGTYVIDPDQSQIPRCALLIDSELKISDDPFFSLVLDRLQSEIQREGMDCLIERIRGNGDLRIATPAITLGRVGHALLQRHTPQQPPLVALFLDRETRPKPRVSVFQLDDVEAGALAARRLIADGCGHIVFVGHATIPASRERRHGAHEAAKVAEIAFDNVESSLNYLGGTRTGAQLKLPDSDAKVGIIAANDWLALGLRAGLDRRHATAQREIPIASFDGLSMTQDPTLRIHSLRVPIESIAADSVAELRRLSQSPIAAGRVIKYSLEWPEESMDNAGS